MKIFKYISNIGLALIATLTLVSCNALDLSPIDHYGSGNFWNTTAQVEGYMNGLHNHLRGSYSMLYTLGEARGGTLRSGTSSLNTSIDMSDPIKNNQFTKDKTGVSNWSGIYNKVMQINHFIIEVEKGCNFLSAPQKNYYLAQAYGMRAFYYSYLFRTFGGVPIVKTVKVLDGKISAAHLYTARSTASEVLDFIKSDINHSEELFGDTFKGKPNKWSKYATYMLKAEMYMWAAKVSVNEYKASGAADLEIAKDALKKVEGQFTLLNDFSEVFADKNNKEIIFTLTFKDNEATNWAANFMYSKDVFVNQRYDGHGNVFEDVLDLRGNGLLRHEYKNSLWSAYDEKDSRRDKTFLAHYDKEGKNQGLILLKGIGIINSNGNRVYETDIVVYRYSDMLLMLAEVENSLGNDPSKYINEVRERAFGKEYGTAYAYVNGSFEANELAILAERDKEFVWEGKRWFDVVRMRDANKESLVFSAKANYANPESTEVHPILDKATEQHKLLWPVDVGTLNNDDLLVQTPGYEEN